MKFYEFCAGMMNFCRKPHFLGKYMPQSSRKMAVSERSNSATSIYTMQVLLAALNCTRLTNFQNIFIFLLKIVPQNIEKKTLSERHYC
jgi:hypothetical protein